MSEALLHRTETGLLTKQTDETHIDYLYRMCCCVSFIIFLTMVLFSSLSLLWHFDIGNTDYNSSDCEMGQLEIMSCCTHSSDCVVPKKYVYLFSLNTTYCKNTTFLVFDQCRPSAAELGNPKYYPKEKETCYTRNEDCHKFSLTNKKSEDQQTLRHWIALTIISSSLIAVVWISILIMYCNSKYFFKNDNTDYSPRQIQRQKILNQ